MVLLSAVAGAAYAQEAPAPEPAVAQQAAPVGTAQTPAPTNRTPAATGSNSPQAKTPTTATTMTATTPAGASPDILKKARRNGYHTRIRNGNTYFCKKEAPVGSRLVQERCMTEDMLVAAFEKQQQQRDNLRANMDVCGAKRGVCGANVD